MVVVVVAVMVVVVVVVLVAREHVCGARARGRHVKPYFKGLAAGVTKRDGSVVPPDVLLGRVALARATLARAALDAGEDM